MNTVKSSTIIKKGCTNMKTISNTLEAEQNTFTMHSETVKNMFWNVAETEKTKALKKEMQEAIKQYPRLHDMFAESERTSEALHKENIQLGERITMYEQKERVYNALNESELSKEVKQLRGQVANLTKREIEFQDTLLEMENACNEKLKQYSENYRQLQNEYTKLAEHINNNQGLLRSWNKDARIKQLEEENKALKKRFSGGGRKPLPPEKVAEIKRLFELGNSKYSIAKAVNVSQTSVWRYTTSK